MEATATAVQLRILVLGCLCRTFRLTARGPKLAHCAVAVNCLRPGSRPGTQRKTATRICHWHDTEDSQFTRRSPGTVTASQENIAVSWRQLFPAESVSGKMDVRQNHHLRGVEGSCAHTSQNVTEATRTRRHETSTGEVEARSQQPTEEALR